jgi:hypothetical protein
LEWNLVNELGVVLEQKAPGSICPQRLREPMRVGRRISEAAPMVEREPDRLPIDKLKLEEPNVGPSHTNED